MWRSSSKAPGPQAGLAFKTQRCVMYNNITIMILYNNTRIMSCRVAYVSQYTSYYVSCRVYIDIPAGMTRYVPTNQLSYEYLYLTPIAPLHSARSGGSACTGTPPCRCLSCRRRAGTSPCCRAGCRGRARASLRLSRAGRRRPGPSYGRILRHRRRRHRRRCRWTRHFPVCAQLKSSRAHNTASQY